MNPDLSDRSYGSRTINNWQIIAKNGRLIAFGLSRSEAKRRIKGTSHRATQW